MRLKGLLPPPGAGGVGSLCSILHRGDGTGGDVGEMKTAPEMVCEMKVRQSRAGEVEAATSMCMCMIRGSPGQGCGPTDFPWDMRRKDRYSSGYIGR